MAIVHSSMSNETNSKPNASSQDETEKIDDNNNKSNSNTNGGSHTPAPPAAAASPLKEENDVDKLSKAKQPRPKTTAATASHEISRKQAKATRAAVTITQIPTKEQQKTAPTPHSPTAPSSSSVSIAAPTVAIQQQQQQQHRQRPPQARIIPIPPTSKTSSLTSSSVAPVKVGTTTVIGVSVPMKSNSRNAESSSPRPGKPLIISGPTASASRRAPIISATTKTTTATSATSTVSKAPIVTTKVVSTALATAGAKAATKSSLAISKHNDKDALMQNASRTSTKNSNSTSINMASGGSSSVSSKNKSSKVPLSSPLSKAEANTNGNGTDTMKKSGPVKVASVTQGGPRKSKSTSSQSMPLLSSSKIPPKASPTIPTITKPSIRKDSKQASSTSSNSKANNVETTKGKVTSSVDTNIQMDKTSLPQSLAPPPQVGSSQSKVTKSKSTSVASAATASQGGIGAEIRATSVATNIATKQETGDLSSNIGNLKQEGGRQQQQQDHSQQQNIAKSLEPSPDFLPRPLINTDMKQIITDILILLQTYGPLTVYQIEYNLPPYPTLDSSQPTPSSLPTISESSTSTAASVLTSGSLASSSPEYRFKIIQDVLDVLSVIQVIHKTTITNPATPDELSSSRASASMPKSNEPTKNGSGSNNGKGGQIQHPKEKIVYFFNNGKVRGDVIYPWEIIDMIRDANEEINESSDRIELLKKELGEVGGSSNPSAEIKVQTPAKSGRKRKIDKLNAMSTAVSETTAITPIVASSIPPSQRMKTTREFLKVILCKYPDVVHDPVYNAALRNFNVDLGAVARERERYSNLMSGGGTTTGGRRGSSSKTNAGDGDSKKGSGNTIHGTSNKRKNSTPSHSSSSAKKKRVRKNSFAKTAGVNGKGNVGKKDASKLPNGRAKVKNINSQTKKNHNKNNNGAAETLPNSAKSADHKGTGVKEKESLASKEDKNQKEKNLPAAEKTLKNVASVTYSHQNENGEKKRYLTSETPSILKDVGKVKEKKGKDEKNSKPPPQSQPAPATQGLPKQDAIGIKIADHKNIVKDKAG